MTKGTCINCKADLDLDLNQLVCPHCGVSLRWGFSSGASDRCAVYTRVHSHAQIDVAKEVGSPYLGGRYRYQGLYSGEEFLRSTLIPALSTYDVVEVFLDGIMGPTPSFFEEAFGGAVRHYGPAVRHRIQLVAAANQHLVPQITQYMDEAAGALTR